MDGVDAPTSGCPVPSFLCALISFSQNVQKGTMESSKEGACKLDRGLMLCLESSGEKSWKAVVNRACGLVGWVGLCMWNQSDKADDRKSEQR